MNPVSASLVRARVWRELAGRTEAQDVGCSPQVLWLALRCTAHAARDIIGQSTWGSQESSSAAGQATGYWTVPL